MPVRPRRAAAIREQIGALGNRERGQEQGEPHGEVLVAPHSPFEPANGLGARKARRLLGLSPNPAAHFAAPCSASSTMSSAKRPASITAMPRNCPK